MSNQKANEDRGCAFLIAFMLISCAAGSMWGAGAFFFSLGTMIFLAVIL